MEIAFARILLFKGGAERAPLLLLFKVPKDYYMESALDYLRDQKKILNVRMNMVESLDIDSGSEQCHIKSTNCVLVVGSP